MAGQVATNQSGLILAVRRSTAARLALPEIKLVTFPTTAAVFKAEIGNSKMENRHWELETAES